MARRRPLLPALLLLIFALLRPPAAHAETVLLWWNVENLFDTTNDPGVRDEEYTPKGKRRWTEKKLLLKQMRLAHLLSAVEAHPDYRRYPDVLAFAEVENREVFEGLLKRIEKVGYRTLYHDSPDLRGIDIALAYNPRTITPLSLKAYRVQAGERPTRDILAAGFTASGHPLHLVLNHWPSRAFDTAWSEPWRIEAATVARAIIDSLRQADPQADIVVMGDCNDHPDNRSLQLLGSSLDARNVQQEPALLYNLWALRPNEGSYFYRKRWEQIDHILVSRGLFDRRGHRLADDPFRCYAFPPLLQQSGEPWRTYRGSRYLGGYSDHLPLILKLVN